MTQPDVILSFMPPKISLNNANHLPSILQNEKYVLISQLIFATAIMECKIRTLFIYIALSFFAGFISYTYFMESESVSVYEYLSEHEDTTVSQYLVTPEIYEGDALRHFPPTKRVNSSLSTKCSITYIKGNNIQYTSSPILESTQRFPSGLSEGRKRLISFGVLII